ncbi:TetR family transcriptional regulator [Ruania zhangjianzhongii]|uniref:TetR family transcriptional regulator n=1 Tax=Ruania zhangjianzhongii TaxID=2603206 RepID=UPI0011CA605E|nr:TetR family transcriptional regulator [Ruania zhangjianzhongii]
MDDVHLTTGVRRGAPPRGQRLTRAAVIERATALIATDGLAHFSLRRLAQSLGVRPNALYNHVRSRDDLLDGVTEQFVGGLRLPTGVPDWPDWIRTAAIDLRRQLGQRTGLTALALDRAGGTTAGPQLLGEFIERLVAAGVDRAVAHLAWHVMLTVVVGSLEPERSAAPAGEATFEAVLDLALTGIVRAAAEPPSAQARALLAAHAPLR